MEEKQLFEAMQAAVAAGEAERAQSLAKQALDAGIDPVVIMDRGFTSSLRVVGDCWERGDLYLPEMMLAAEAVKAALEILKPRLQAAAAAGGIAPSTCVMGTVRGDIHDIGKNIVGTMLQAWGFRVVDLGTDVDPGRFVAAVKETGAALLGMSALLTSTMPAMRAVIEALEAAGLRPKVRVAVGGAPLSPAYARDIGADGYAEDGAAALRLFQRLAAAGPAGSSGGGESRHAL